ncbi:MAG: ASCH domain-containing protein [Pseudomonadota bacterium]
MVALRRRYPGAEISEFGDSRPLSDELIGLILSGRKTATCFALRDIEASGEPMPVVGRRDIVIDWDGRPVLVTETTEITRLRFRDVPEDFALAEGEGTFRDWRRGHISYFERNGGWSEGMWLGCERFRVVEILS